MLNIQPTCCLEVYFQNVHQHTGGKWLNNDSKCREDNQLQSLKLPYINILVEYVESNIQNEDPETKTSREVRDCVTQNT